uniref:Uncharacterized protein n=1 Tax=Anguilla anguilla TaxID=7936 RepID=A0A0E9VUR7_ANGAN
MGIIEDTTQGCFLLVEALIDIGPPIGHRLPPWSFSVPLDGAIRPRPFEDYTG